MSSNVSLNFSSTASTRTEKTPAVIAVYVFYILIGAVGICGNSMVIIIFCGSRIKPRNILLRQLLIHQSIVDLGSSVMLLIQNIGPEIVVPDGIIGELFCKLWKSGFFMWSCITASTLNLSFISLERYFGICHPIKHQIHLNESKVKVIIIFLWIFALLATIFWSFWPIDQINVNGICLTSYDTLSLQRFHGVMVFMYTFFIPLGVMCFAYASIYLKLKQRPNFGSIRLMAQRKTIKTLILVSLAYVVCWSPNSLIYLAYNLGIYVIDFNSALYHYTVLSAFSNMMINPFFYSFRDREFCAALNQLIRPGRTVHAQLALVRSAPRGNSNRRVSPMQSSVPGRAMAICSHEGVRKTYGC